MPARILIAALWTVVALAATARAEEANPPPRTINASGEAVVYATPDQVTVGFGVQTFSPDLDKATALNEDAGSHLVKAVTALGVERKDVQADNLQITIRYRNGGPVNGIEGYVADRTYSVKLRDTKLFDKLINTALKSGANQLMGFNFETTELRKYRDQARKMAIKAAREKAADLAKELDCGVGKPRTINEGYLGFLGGSYGRYQQMSQNAMQNAGVGAGDESESLPLGQIGIRAQVSVIFDLTVGQ